MAGTWKSLKINSRDELAKFIDDIINFPSDSKKLDNEREAFWSDEHGVIVITDPGDKDGGTAFKPRNGKDYYKYEIE